MVATPTLRTARLELRGWRPSDREPFAALNADPDVMARLPHVLTRAESDDFVDRIEEHFETWGFGLWAVEVVGVADFIGFVGLSRPGFNAHFMPAVEVGWRLAKEHWGHGYATEGAAGAVRFGFEQAGLDEIVSFTTPAHAASRVVMERLGMVRDPADDFDHPRLGPESPLYHHVLYRLPRARWEAANRVDPGATGDPST